MEKNKTTRTQDIFIDFTNKLSLNSKCKHGKCAAILVSEDFTQVYSVGINGGPSKIIDCACGEEDAKYGCAHAEQNCLVKNANFDKPKIMISTRCCCPTCATLIINSKANIKEFWFTEDYKDHKGLEWLMQSGIKVVQLQYR